MAELIIITSHFPLRDQHCQTLVKKNSLACKNNKINPSNLKVINMTYYVI